MKEILTLRRAAPWRPSARARGATFAFSDELADKRRQLAEIDWRATSMVQGLRIRGRRPPRSTEPVLVVDQLEPGWGSVTPSP